MIFFKVATELAKLDIRQGRPFREGIRENPTLWWGLVAASAVAFSGATDFMPELNRWLQIVVMEDSVSDIPLEFSFNLAHVIASSVQVPVDRCHGN